MEELWLTERTDENTAVFYLTTDGDLVDTLDDVAADPFAGEPTKVITHGMYPGSVDYWKRWIKNQL